MHPLLIDPREGEENPHAKRVRFRGGERYYPLIVEKKRLSLSIFEEGKTPSRLGEDVRWGRDLIGRRGKSLSCRKEGLSVRGVSRSTQIASTRVEKGRSPRL